MKKTATITFHRAINYGAVLQAYALQKSILKLNVENELLDYKPNTIYNVYKLIRMDSLKNFIKSCIIFPFFIYKKKKFNDFIEKNMYLSKEINKKELNTINFNNNYDLFITGSDQVWNYELINMDGSFLLDFVKDKRKITSYAASFGISSIPEALKGWYIEKLKRFSTILLREKTGKLIVEELINKDEKVVLDPVFLLNQKEWDRVTGKTKFDKIKDKYILVYISTPLIMLFAKKLSKKYNIPVFFIGNIKFNTNCKFEMQLGPEEFISAIKNAKIVLTASFHALAFSIIYNKIFFINLNKEKYSRASRQIDLMELLEIKNREIADLNEIVPINWEKVNEKLEIERNKSLEELKHILNVVD